MKKDFILQVTVKISELINKSKIINEKMNARLKALIRAVETDINKQNKVFIDIYFIEIM